MKIKNFLATSAAAGVMAISIAFPAFAATTTIVKPADLELPSSPTDVQESWYFYDDTNNTASSTESSPNYEFTVGPSTPPLGVGSVSFELTGNTERWNIATNQLAGTALSDISALSFDMYTPTESTGGTTTTLFMNFDVDFDTSSTSGYQGRLVYVPQDNGTPTLDTWETWDGIDNGDAMWRYSRPTWPGTATPGTTPRTWSDITTSYPDASVFNESFAGQFLVRAGHPGPTGLMGSVDNVVLNDVAYDFEPALTPISKDECKDGGWMSFNTPTFTNQGQCVSYVVSNENAGKRD